MLNATAQPLRTAAAFWRLGLAEGYAYRAGYVNLLLSYPLIIFANYYLYGALYGDGRTSIAGYDATEMLTYVSVAWIMRSALVTSVDRLMGDMVRTGDIAAYLIKPIGLFWALLGRTAGGTAYRLSVSSLPLAVLIGVFGSVRPPAGWGAAGFFALSVALAYLIFFTFRFLIGTLAFRFEYSVNFSWMFDLLTQLLGGLVAPISLFPSWLRVPISLLPFQGIYSTPVQLYLGKATIVAVPGTGGDIGAGGAVAGMGSGADTLIGLGGQAAWLLVLLALAFWSYRSGIRKLSVQGG